MDLQSADDITGALCVFFSGSPFSDFSSHSFQVEGIVYASVEHFFQIQMLRSFGLFKLAMKLSTIFDANHFRRTLRQNLRSLSQNGLFDDRMFASWRSTNALRLIKRANRAKFEQNFDLKKHLLETGDRILVFTSKHDRLLGIGMDELTFLNWVRQQRWTIDQLLDNFTRSDSIVDGILGRNLLGFCLMDIRAEISGQPSVLSLWKLRVRETIDKDTEEMNEKTVESQESISQIGASDIGGTKDLPELIDLGDDLDNRLTDDHILANLSNAEASINQECNGIPATESSALIYRVPNERRIIYRRSDNVQRSDAGASIDQHSQPVTSVDQSIIESSDAPSTSNMADSGFRSIHPIDLDRRMQVLERLKKLRFEKPMINPFSEDTTVGPDMQGTSQMIPGVGKSMYLSRPAVNHAQQRKIPRLCDIRPIRGPTYGRSRAIVYPQLELGEVPSPDYGPTVVPVGHPSNFHNGQFQNAPVPMANEQPFSAHSSVMQQPFPTAESSISDNEPGELWTPSSNPMKEIFESAKVGIKKLIENVKQDNPTNDEISQLLLLRPPPIQSQPDARKRKGTRKKAAPSYAGIFFNSKDAQMRHMSNRWIKGGRLTTTGEFEECQSDDDDNDNDEQQISRTLRQLEAVPASMDTENDGRPSTPVQLHVVYEDTNEYADYVKWYADVHGCSPCDVVEDEYQQYLRQWYRWYKTAVKFVDVEPLSDHEDTDADADNEDKSQLLMQQWRWQQINEWELKTRNHSSKATIHHETATDGVSFSGKPVAYKPNV